MEASAFRALTIVVAGLVGWNVAVADTNGVEPKLPSSIPFTLIGIGPSNHTLHGTLLLNDSVRPAFATSYMKLWSLAAEFERQLHVEPQFEFMGKEDPQRSVCTEIRALDRTGKLVYHDWELSGDGRIGPAEISFGSFRGERSRLSSPAFDIPRERARDADRLEIRFREIRADDLRHFPTRPHKCDARVTAPDTNGEFEVSFTNPESRPIEADCLVAFECVVFDAEQNVVRTDFRVVEPLPKEVRYCFKVKVEPGFYDYSCAGIGFFKREHGRSREWLLKHLSAEWGVTYSGCSDGGKLSELPLVGTVAFDDLPELAPIR